MKPQFRLLPLVLGLAAALGACNDDDHHDAADPTAQVKNLVVIYAENRAFDNVFGDFPGAHGLSEVLNSDGTPNEHYVKQADRDGSELPTLPRTWGGVTNAGVLPVVTEAQSDGLANAPFSIEDSYGLTTATKTRDLYHRFFENQMSIDGGKNDKFAAWEDAGGLTMGHYDYSGSKLYALAKQYVLADNFFAGAFGGSFLNHQYLVCACAPEYPNADDPAGPKPTIAVLDKDADGHFTPNLTPAADAKASALDGPPKFVLSGNITPKDYFGDGKFYGVNTMQAPYQPSGNKPADAQHLAYANPAASTTMPPQTATTIGDLLDAKNVSWTWYAGSWNAALADGTQDPAAARTVIYGADANGLATAEHVDFQPHHQPFNYYKAFDPGTADGAAERAAHLKDYEDLVADVAAGTLPAVTFYKPQGNFNQHEQYANLDDGDAHIADLVAKLKASPQWPNMLIVITYDEFGGVWDHVAPPKGDKLGPGTRIPAIIISPLSKKNGTVDHTPYDTASVLRFITHRWGLDTLPGLKTRDDALQANGAAPMGDLSAVLQ